MPGPQGQWGPPNWPPPVRPAPSVFPERPTGYVQFWRAPGIPAWLPIVATILMAVSFVALTTVIVLGALFVGGTPTLDELEAIAEGSLSPALVLANSVSIALVLPVGFLVARMLKQRPGYLSSVVGRFRWGFFWKATAVVSVVFLLYTAITFLSDDVEAMGLEVREHTWWLLVGLLLVTPFQAAAEEYLLRGYVLRTVGSWFAGPVPAVLVGGLINTLIFMSLHASLDPWLNLVYFTMGTVGTYLVWRTGGLEGAVAIHVVNNMIGMAILPFQDMAAQFDRSAGAGGPEVLFQVLATVIAGALIVWLARRENLARVGQVPPPEGRQLEG